MMGTRGKTHRGRHPAQGLALVTHKGGHVHRNDARGALPDGKIVGQILFGDPAALSTLPLQNGQHGVAAAKGHAADLCKGEEQLR